MRARTLVLLGIVAYAIFLAARFPARWAAPRAALPPGMALTDVHGTVWNGDANLAMPRADGSAPLARIRWHLLPARLASARLAYAIDAQGSGLEGHGEIARTPGGFEARGVRVRADAAGLAALSPLLAAWRPQGTVTIEAPALAWDGRDARGEAHAEWHEASLAVTDVRPLGTYRLDVRADGGPARIAVTTLDGALRIAGQGTFAPPQALAFSGEARAEGPSAGALEPLLNLLGPRRADGARTIDWRTVPPSTAPRS